MKIISLCKFFKSNPLTNKSILRAFGRYFYYQSLKRIRPKLIYKFINNSKLLLHKNDSSGYACAYAGLVEFQDQAFLLHFLAKNDKFIDIGANTGVYTVLASAVRKSKTISIEPIKEISEKLKDNIKLNDIGELVTILNVGVSSKKSSYKFLSDGAASQIILNDNSKENLQEIETISLDQIIQENQFYPSLIKIDVEGFELEVLKGGSEILKNEKLLAVIIEINLTAMNQFGYGFEDINEIFTENGFSLYLYDPFNRKLNLATLQQVLATSNNGIYIRNLNFVNKILKEAPSFNVLNFEI